MTIYINRGESRESIEKKLKKLPSSKSAKKVFPAHLFTGKVKIKGDPLEIQRKLRDEW